MNYAAVDRAIRSGDAYRAVSALCRPALTEIAEGRREMRAVRHPLGFLCLPLYRDGLRGVCLHVWSQALAHVEPTTSQIHSHSWDLLSYVLYGRVGNTLMQVVDDPAAGAYRIFEVHSQGDLDEIRATPRQVRCLAAGHETAGPGDLYQLPAGRFHRTVVQDGSEAATVALGRVRAALDLSLGRLDTPTHRVRRQHCGPQETTRAAAIVLARLVDQPACSDSTGRQGLG
ncbi:MAG TPA: hypothetical protein VFM55_26940 [Micromonosporaceae bacterium]|nr:hypothetical protein [Micromonosporaceae bacterium]